MWLLKGLMVGIVGLYVYLAIIRHTYGLSRDECAKLNAEAQRELERIKQENAVSRRQWPPR
jgi:hypothetical protein